MSQEDFKMKKHLNYAMLFVASLITTLVYAPPVPPGPCNNPPCGGPNAPIDNYIIIGILVAVSIGTYFLIKKVKDKNII